MALSERGSPGRAIHLGDTGHDGPDGLEETQERIPDGVRAAIEATVGRALPKAWAVADLTRNLTFGQEWIILMRDGTLCVVESDAAGAWQLRQSHSRGGILRVRDHVATAALILEHDGITETLCRFTAARRSIFDRLAGSANAVSQSPSDHPSSVVTDPPGRRDPRQHRGEFSRLMAYFPRYGRTIASIALLMVVVAVLQLVGPFLSGRFLFDHVLSPGGRYSGMLIELIAVLVATHVFAGALTAAYRWMNAGLSAQVAADLKGDGFAAIQRLSLGFFVNRQTGGLLNNLFRDTMRVHYLFQQGIPQFAANTVVIAGVGVILALMDWRLAIGAFIPLPLVVIAVRKLGPRLETLFSRQYRKESDLLARVNENITGVRVVKAFGKESDEIDRFERVNDQTHRANAESRAFEATISPLLFLIVQGGALIVWAGGGWSVASGGMTLGTLVSFIFYLTLLYEPLRFMTETVDLWYAAMSSARRLFQIVDAAPDVREADHPVRLGEPRGDVELREATFAYQPGQPVLHHIDLKIGAGETIGVVGRTGAGKTTLTNLILRLYDVDEGAVLIDGIDVRELSVRDLRRQVGVVLQDPYLFVGTIAENIAFSRPEADRAEVMDAARIANAHEFIIELPDGYDTSIGRGRDLSGGEKQRIAIARAVLMDPRILILDEATASVDTQTELRIQQALQRLVAGRTTIAIAHRLSTLRNADRLVVLERGRIVQEGTHDDLIGGDGAYARLVRTHRNSLRVIGVGE